MNALIPTTVKSKVCITSWRFTRTAEDRTHVSSQALASVWAKSLCPLPTMVGKYKDDKATQSSNALIS